MCVWMCVCGCVCVCVGVNVEGVGRVGRCKRVRDGACLMGGSVFQELT